MKKCLLLKTPDNREFFTEESYYPLLVEFGKTFNAEISVVQTKEQVRVLSMEDLAKSICTTQENPSTEYETIETKLVMPRNKKREDKLKTAKEINDTIKKIFIDGKTVSLSDLEIKFPAVTKSTLANLFTRTKRELQTQGHHLVKLKPGQYKIAYNLKED